MTVSQCPRNLSCSQLPQRESWCTWTRWTFDCRLGRIPGCLHKVKNMVLSQNIPYQWTCWLPGLERCASWKEPLESWHWSKSQVLTATETTSVPASEQLLVWWKSCWWRCKCPAHHQAGSSPGSWMLSCYILSKFTHSYSQNWINWLGNSGFL
jgi:hypothetical protein